MQIAAGWVAPQRPAALTGLLPGSDRERMIEEPRDGLKREGLGSHRAGPIQIVISGRRGLVLRRGAWKRHQGRAREAPKRIRLICPVQIAERSSVPEEVMLGFLVVADHLEQRGCFDVHRASVYLPTR